VTKASRIFQFKLRLTHHMFCRHMHKYLANDQEYSVEFWISLSTSNKERDVFNAWLWRQTRRVNSSPEKKRLPRDLAVSDILPGIVAQVKHEVGSSFLYYSRWITRPLSHSSNLSVTSHTDTFLLILFPGLRSHPHLPDSSPATLPPSTWCNPAQSRHFSPLLERS